MSRLRVKNMSGIRNVGGICRVKKRVGNVDELVTQQNTFSNGWVAGLHCKRLYYAQTYEHMT